ncbi:hypothetical protein Dimus_025176 [Dionaea muscipula]
MLVQSSMVTLSCMVANKLLRSQPLATFFTNLIVICLSSLSLIPFTTLTKELYLALFSSAFSMLLLAYISQKCFLQPNLPPSFLAEYIFCYFSLPNLRSSILCIFYYDFSIMYPQSIPLFHSHSARGLSNVGG